MKVLITADKFRGSLDASEVLDAISNGILSVDQHIKIDTSVLADGGEGSLKLLSDVFHCSPHEFEVKNAAGDMMLSSLGWNHKTKVAILETASYVGLAQLEETQRNPLTTSSFGLGMAMREAAKLGAKKIIVGLGGSATNDGGAGMLAALGFQLLSKEAVEIIPNGSNIGSISKIIQPEKMILDEIEMILAVDVQNLLTGPTGATLTFGKQKGASKKDLVILEENMIGFARLVQHITSKEVFNKKGYGAAGGIPLSACAFLNAEVISGSQLVFDSLNLEKRIKKADLIITGEGKIDSQTRYGKAIEPIITACKYHKKKLIFVCGSFEATARAEVAAIPRYELRVLANELNMDSFKDAFKLCEKIGQKIVRSLKK